MMHAQPPAAVIVGIDGSASALHAAEWAVEEAVDRDVPLRLVHVIESMSVPAPLAAANAGAILQAAAQAAASLTGESVKIETVIARGSVVGSLVAESADAYLLCLGSSGVQPGDPGGAIATAVARKAQCPLALIRTDDDAPRCESDDIAVLVDESLAGDVLQVALDEARLRNATLLILRLARSQHGPFASGRTDHYLADWLGRYPDVQTHILDVPGDVPTFLRQHDPPVQLLVSGNYGEDAAGRLTGPFGQFALCDAPSSVLLVHF